MNKLLEGVELEWKSLDNLCLKISSGNNKNKSQDGLYPVYGSTGIIGRTNTRNYNTKLILVARVGANAGYVHIGEGEYDVSDNTLIVQCNDSVNLKYLYYYLVNIKLNRFAQGGGQPLITGKLLKELQIPIPPFEIQKEIVRILDSFTELTTKLTTELKVELLARKKQYTYYREQLFAFKDEEVDWKPLGEIGELVRGNGLPKTDFTETGVPAIHYGQIYTYYGIHTSKTISFVSSETAKKLRKVNYGDVVITNTSENLEDVGKAVVYLGEEQAVTGGHATIFKPSKKITGKFFAYFTQTSHFSNQKRKYAKGIKVIDVSATDMAKIIIPIPSLEEQERIITILDKFDTLTNSISESLPKEIELRKKQYEYYRDMLLRFPKVNLIA